MPVTSVFGLFGLCIGIIVFYIVPSCEAACYKRAEDVCTYKTAPVGCFDQYQIPCSPDCCSATTVAAATQLVCISNGIGGQYCVPQATLNVLNRGMVLTPLWNKDFGYSSSLSYPQATLYLTSDLTTTSNSAFGVATSKSSNPKQIVNTLMGAFQTFDWGSMATIMARLDLDLGQFRRANMGTPTGTKCALQANNVWHPTQAGNCLSQPQTSVVEGGITILGSDPSYCTGSCVGDLQNLIFSAYMDSVLDAMIYYTQYTCSRQAIFFSGGQDFGNPFLLSPGAVPNDGAQIIGQIEQSTYQLTCSVVPNDLQNFRNRVYRLKADAIEIETVDRSEIERKLAGSKQDAEATKTTIGSGGGKKKTVKKKFVGLRGLSESLEIKMEKVLAPLSEVFGYSSADRSLQSCNAANGVGSSLVFSSQISINLMAEVTHGLLSTHYAGAMVANYAFQRLKTNIKNTAAAMVSPAGFKSSYGQVKASAAGACYIRSVAAGTVPAAGLTSSSYGVAFSTSRYNPTSLNTNLKAMSADTEDQSLELAKELA